MPAGSSTPGLRRFPSNGRVLLRNGLSVGFHRPIEDTSVLATGRVAVSSSIVAEDVPVHIASDGGPAFDRDVACEAWISSR